MVYGIWYMEYILPVYLFRNFKVKVKGRSSGFLPDSCNRKASISSSLQTETRILILAQSFGSGSAQPLLPPLRIDAFLWISCACILYYLALIPTCI